MTMYTRYDVDRLYRHLPDVAADLWLTQPSYDTQPRERRPVDELPLDVTEYLSRAEALEHLTTSQRIVFKAVVMGLVRTYRNGAWCDTRARPMTYRECAEYLDLADEAIGMRLMRARDRLAKILSDDEEAA